MKNHTNNFEPHFRLLDIVSIHLSISPSIQLTHTPIHLPT